MKYQAEKGIRHLGLALVFDGMLAVLIGGPIWITIRTQGYPNEEWLLQMWWWPWLLAVSLGIAVWYLICDDKEAIQQILLIPKIVLYTVLLIVSFPWWVRKLKDSTTLPEQDRTEK